MNPTIKYSVDPTTGCWVWRGSMKSNGYGTVHTRDEDGRKKTRHAHRFMYERLKGEIPSGLQLDHLCRNPACVNPDHLEPVTHAENLRRGNGTKLTVEQVLEIRASSASHADLARQYDVNPSHILRIRTREMWRDVRSEDHPIHQSGAAA